MFILNYRRYMWDRQEEYKSREEALQGAWALTENGDGWPINIVDPKGTVVWDINTDQAELENLYPNPYNASVAQ